jgi:hypothetical protein
MTGDSRDALVSAREALTAQMRSVAAADRVLADTVRGAYVVASESLRRIAVLQSEIDTAVAFPVRGYASAGELHRFLLDKNRQLTVILSQANSSAAAKTVVLQALSDSYLSAAQR